MSDFDGVHLLVGIYWMMPCWRCNLDVLAVVRGRKVFFLELCSRGGAELPTGGQQGAPSQQAARTRFDVGDRCIQEVYSLGQLGHSSLIGDGCGSGSR